MKKMKASTMVRKGIETLAQEKISYWDKRITGYRAKFLGRSLKSSVAKRLWKAGIPIQADTGHRSYLKVWVKFEDVSLWKRLKDLGEKTIRIEKDSDQFVLEQEFMRQLKLLVKDILPKGTSVSRIQLLTWKALAGRI